MQQEGGEPQLYDLAADIGESVDRAADEPERVAALRSRFETWNEQLVAPLWRYGKKRAKKK